MARPASKTTVKAVAKKRSALRRYTKADYTDFEHTGPDTLAGRYMRLFWQPVFIAEDLKSGQALPIRIMNEDFTLYRGEGGKPHVVDARCPHRGSVLNTGWVVGETIRCLYHGWRFDAAGQCVEMPAEDENFLHKVKIGGYPTEEYLGLIFVYFGEGAPLPLPRYAEFEGEGVLDVNVYTRLCNYFQNVENNVDPAHTPFTHSQSSYVDQGLVGLPEVNGHESEWGIAQLSKRPNGGLRISHHGQPTILNLKFQPTDDESGWKELITWRVPVDDNYHKAFLVYFVHIAGAKAERYRMRMVERKNALAALSPAAELAQAVIRGELSVRDKAVLGRPDYLEIQDHVAQQGQGVFADRSRERLGRTDMLVILLRKIWAREMKALAEGKPLKQWHRPPEISPTIGIPGAKLVPETEEA